MLREKVLAMKAIWAGNNAEFHGEFVDFAPILTGLRPRQEPHPPILIGGQGSRGIARTVEYGDGWMPIVYEELDPRRTDAGAGATLSGRRPARRTGDGCRLAGT